MNEASRQMVILESQLEEPREACGLVWYDQAFIVPNIAKHGGDFFIMDIDEVQRLYTMMACPATGVWHSHPGGSEDPSDSDLLYHPKGMRLFIVCDGEVHDHGVPG